MADTAWFLQFDTVAGDGVPWGDGTAMAARAGNADPWDVQCAVTPIVGGFAAMKAIRDALEKTITDAEASAEAPGDRGHVYVAGWRFNAQRDTSDNVKPWPMPYPTLPLGVRDQTALGLLFRLMQAGVRIRVMVWQPTLIETLGADAAPHGEDHLFSAQAISVESEALTSFWQLDEPLGVMALDARTAEGSIAGTHHQKMIVIRGLNGNDVAFAGGVDLAFTRRDSPDAAPGGNDADTPSDGWDHGDWQSGTVFPQWSKQGSWPRDTVTDYGSFDNVDVPKDTQGTDLPELDPLGQAHLEIYGPTNQRWHDQHLKLQGPIVQTLEDQFAERWRDSAPGRIYDLSNSLVWFGGQVIFSSPDAIKDGDIVALPASTAAVAPAGSAIAVQMLRTVPWRNARDRAPFKRGEFTAVSGISRAVSRAQQLIWIFDQYFWSLPLARQLNERLVGTDTLRVIVLLPPYADANPAVIHQARKQALDELVANVGAQVGVYNLWDPSGPRGVYCHAKVQMYDSNLLICGSANLNRRSFLCDSEIACGVLDDATVIAHQQRLWTLLFKDVPGPDGQWPALDLAADWGGTFFSAFTKAALSSNAGVRLDPWQSPNTPTSPALDNTVVLPRGDGTVTQLEIGHVFDPTSLDPAYLERKVEIGTAASPQTRPARLDDVVARLDKAVRNGATVTMPNRRQSSELRLPLSEKADS